ncbi:TPA: prepilin-type N-terminal cleavage/methylation domain-containing protein [Aeromonas veronii bv. veronii]|nr:prepilin-type N-terminal cleavage/methylation domain-containing protein [Aeromonas veronii bv. veronii]
MQQRGFTLLELLVVLTLIGMIAAVVGPRFLEMADKLRHRNDWQTVQQAINELPFTVRQRGVQVVLGSHTDDIPLPQGWQLKAPQPIYYLANGICLGGELQILADGVIKQSIQLESPYCQWQGIP